MQIGPLRDTLAHLSAARDADQWITVEALAERLGPPIAVIEARLKHMVDDGLVRTQEFRGQLVYQATQEGQDRVR